MTQLEVEIALERYRNEIESLKHRMDEVQSGSLTLLFNIPLQKSFI